MNEYSNFGHFRMKLQVGNNGHEAGTVETPSVVQTFYGFFGGVPPDHFGISKPLKHYFQHFPFGSSLTTSSLAILRVGQ